MEINLLEFRTKDSTSFIGTGDGKAARKALKLNQRDFDEYKYTLVIPPDTTSFNPSFFMGFLGESVENLGITLFQQKYQFVYINETAEVTDALEKNTRDGLQNVINRIHGTNAEI